MADKKVVTWGSMRNYWQVYLLVFPSVCLVGLFAYYPVLNGTYHAFFRWNGDFINDFVGFRHFKDALYDDVLWYGFFVVSILVAANLFKMIPSIMTAVAINRLKNEKMAYFYKVMFVIPMIIPGMVSLLIWKFFFDPGAGILNSILNNTGLMHILVWIDGLFGWGVFLAGQNPVWLGNSQLVIPSLIIWGFPWVGAVSVLIYLAGLQGIDTSIYESAEIDGITSFKKFLYIELPLILTQVRINLVLMIIHTLEGFGLVLVLFGVTGGPNGVAMVPGLYMFSKAFQSQEVGYACAIGLILFVFILILTEINNRFVRVKK